MATSGQVLYRLLLESSYSNRRNIYTQETMIIISKQ